MNFLIGRVTKHISVHLFYKQYLWESKHYMMQNKYMLNRKFNLAKLFVLHKLSFEYSSSSNLINTFDDSFHHTFMSQIYHLKIGIQDCLHVTHYFLNFVEGLCISTSYQVLVMQEYLITIFKTPHILAWCTG